MAIRMTVTPALEATRATEDLGTRPMAIRPTTAAVTMPTMTTGEAIRLTTTAVRETAMAMTPTTTVAPATATEVHCR